MTEDSTSHEDWRKIFDSRTEGASSQEDWIAYVVEEIESLRVWEIEVHLDDYGWDTSLTKRECYLL
jgi:hypothetical protein